MHIVHIGTFKINSNTAESRSFEIRITYFEIYRKKLICNKLVLLHNQVCVLTKFIIIQHIFVFIDISQPFAITAGLLNLVTFVANSEYWRFGLQRLYYVLWFMVRFYQVCIKKFYHFIVYGLPITVGGAMANKEVT